KTRVLFFTVLTVVLSTTAFCQFTRQQAIDLILNTVLSADTGNIDAYCAYDSYSNQDIVLLDDSDTVSCVYTGNWVFFADYSPACFWAHPAKFIFVNTQNGEYTIIEADMLPRYLYPDFELVSSIPLPNPVEIPEYSGEETPVIAEPKDHLYAVLIGTGPQPVLWYDVSMIYNTLIETYGYKKENIFVHFADNDTVFEWFGGIALPDDLDGGDESDDVDYTAFFSRIDTTFKNLSGLWDNDPAIPELGPDDQLSIHFVGHGNSSDTANKISYLGLMDGHLYDTTFARYLKDINCAQMILTMQNCFSGGFIDDVTDYINYNVKCKNRVLLTSEDYNHTAKVEQHILGKMFYPNGGHSYVYGEFDFYLFSALRGWYPDVDKEDEKIEPWVPSYPLGSFPFFLYETLENHPLDYLPDTATFGNNDGFTQIKEAFNYMNDFNTWSPVGYFNPHPPNTYTGDTIDNPQIGNTLPFEEDVLSMSGIIGQIQNSQSIPGRNYMLGGELAVTGNTNLTFEDSTALYFNGEDAKITVASTAGLNLGDHITVTGLDTGNIVKVNGTLTIGDGAVFSGNTQNKWKGLEIENSTLDLLINDATFTNSNLLATIDEIDITNSSFSNSITEISDADVNISNTDFLASSVKTYLTGTYDVDANISNCDFSGYSATQQYGICIESYPDFYIGGNTINNTECGIKIFSSGSGHGSNDIYNNQITNQANEGAIIYHSYATFEKNLIDNNNYGIKLFDNSNVSISGNSKELEQEIKDNTLYEVYAAYGSFPYYFHYNGIIDEDNQEPLVYYNTPSSNTVDVRYNYWGNNFNYMTDLFRYNAFLWQPTWNPGDGGEGSGAKTMYDSAKDKIEQEEFESAKDTLLRIVSLYPESKYAQASLKELMNLEKYAGNNYNSLKSYYGSEPNIQTYPTLEKLADFLISFCEIKLENYPTAIGWFEDVIQNPESMEDSIFAIIDLGYTYFLMENGGYKSSYVGNMPQHKPTSLKHFEKNRDYLLSLLPSEKNKTLEEHIGQLKDGELMQNIPNPFNGSTLIYYKLEDEATVNIDIYNYTGQKIKTYNMRVKTEGVHYLEFNSSGLSSGIYFYSIEVNGKLSDTKKMTVMK
ncbi:MAG: T9SS type A sorting domain-containing protein, partial [Bacteroidales bacterium]|nr:T9SS type A sorting domain-containing protein [Bacteroidales bacterium]